jgi:hypothetical protein
MAQDLRVLVQLWAQDAQAEHASIASFARVTLQLMAAGAPASLLAETQRATADEVRHARICFGLAALYAGRAVEPGKFPISSPMQLDTDLAAIAAGTASEGCVEVCARALFAVPSLTFDCRLLQETLSCLVMAEACSRCEDPCVRAALASIVKDEARHAALAWRTVQWAVQSGGKAVGESVSAAFKRAAEQRVEQESKAAAHEAGHSGLEAFGRLDSANERRLRAAALTSVVVPMAEALLAGNPLALAEQGLCPVLSRRSAHSGLSAAVLLCSRCVRVCCHVPRCRNGCDSDEQGVNLLLTIFDFVAECGCFVQTDYGQAEQAHFVAYAHGTCSAGGELWMQKTRAATVSHSFALIIAKMVCCAR